MDKLELQKLRDLPIEAVAQRLGLTVERHKALCPFHADKHPSLYFSTSRNTYRCFSCGAHGDVIDLAKNLLPAGAVTSGMSGGASSPFLTACQWLADENNIILTEYKPPPPPTGAGQRASSFDAARYERFFEHPWLSPEAQRFLYQERRLHPAVVRFCRLNSYREWLQIPYYNQEGQLVGIQRRYMGNDPEQPRFRFQRGEQCHLYCQQVIPMLRPGEPIYLAEGPSDTWALLSAGHKAVGIPSATLLKPHDLLPLAGRECHIYPDQDEAGQRLYQQLLAASISIGFCLVRHDLPQGCKDFAEEWKRKN